MALRHWRHHDSRVEFRDKEETWWVEEAIVFTLRAATLVAVAYLGSIW